MKKLQIILVLFVAYLMIGAGSFAPYQLFGAGSGGGGGGTFTGPGDIVSGASSYIGGQAYNAAYANSGGKFANVCLSGDSTCADLSFGSDGNVIDSTVGGSKCSAVTCTIKRIYDQSGANACSGVCDQIQATEANRAKVTFTSGHAYIDCPGGACFYQTGSALASSIAQPYTESIVLNYTNIGTQQAVFYSAPNAESFVNRTGGATIGFFTGGGVPTASMTAAALHAVQMIINSSSSDFYIDGSSNVVDVGNTNAFSAAFMELMSVGGTQLYKGSVGSVGVWSGGFNATQKSNMNSNQHSFWGF